MDVQVFCIKHEQISVELEKKVNQDIDINNQIAFRTSGVKNTSVYQQIQCLGPLLPCTWGRVARILAADLMRVTKQSNTHWQTVQELIKLLGSIHL